MYRPQRAVASAPRYGVILLVVLLLLTLFAIVGISFVLYADAQAASARLLRDAQSQSRPDGEPELLLAYFLGQLIYDVPDDARGVSSALRGHGLARLMYGYNDEPGATNDQPFNGIGRLHAPSPFPEIDDYLLVNYTHFPADGFLRDPERLGWRADLTQPRGPFLGGFNAPYTYPDLNSLFLAAVKADGTLLAPSFHRDWLFRHPALPASITSLDPRNPHWRTPEGKYLLLRPRPIDMGPGFPYPEDASGDVKNLVGAPGGNDSLWLDLDAPVLTAPDGRRYKPLFAPLILDLDNRVNLNVHGNARGAGQGHASNQGWGPWEVNPRRLSENPTAPANAARQREWANLFVGSVRPAWPGRHGGDPWAGRFGTPGSPGVQAPSGPQAHFYAAVDYDACQEDAGFAPSAPLRLPGAGAPPLHCFPLYSAGYGNGSAAERTGHPLLYNPFRPASDDRAFALSNMEALLRHGDTGSGALASELFRLCPRNFADPRLRRLVTTHSFDVNRPGVTPWLWQPTPPQPYRLAEGAFHPAEGPLRFPTPGTPPPVLPDSEFAADWRASTAALGRLDLNRSLPAYPSPAASGRITDLAGFRVAQAARQQLADDLFVRLWTVTGAGAPSRLPPPGAVDHDPARWGALRWLAQLAVNVVDYIDADDYLTPFNWAGGEWVYGTELPRLVLNEAYVEYRSDAEPAEFNVWVELHNPFFEDSSLSDGGAARLLMPDAGPAGGRYGAYQLIITRTSPEFGAPENGRGDPDVGEIYAVMDFTDLTPGTPDRVQPAHGRYAGADGGNEGFYVIGPGPLSGGRATPTHQSPRMRYQHDQLDRPALLLRRLACPHLPPRPDPRAPDHNPYVTVDYLDHVRVNSTAIPIASRASEGRNQPYAADSSQRQPQGPIPPPTDQPRHTFFRHNAREPMPPSGVQPPDQTLKVPFDWLVHLDRPLISPVELLHVSAFKPHELTHRFVTGAGAFQHYAPWLDQGLPAGRSARLYRVLEFLEARAGTAGLLPTGTASPGSVAAGADQAVRPARMSGAGPDGAPWAIRAGDVLIIDGGTPAEENVRVKTVFPPAGPVGFTADFLRPHAPNFTLTLTAGGERVPGRININTVWDRETLRALGDAQAANSFTEAQIDAVFDLMVSPGNRLARTRGPGGAPGPDDRPFRSLATGLTPPGDSQNPSGSGIEDTLLRPVPGTGRSLFQLADATHPYQQFELLTKVYNHLTVRSNVFAVWLTVGFFEVTDDTARPVKLGPEVGRAENRHVRHRMFAIIDRSVLVHNPGAQAGFDPRALSPGTSPVAPPHARRVVPYCSVID